MVQRLIYFVGLGVVGGVLLGGGAAFAYPQYIAKGYATCGSCHYSVDGGGALNAYGAATVEAMVPDEVFVEWVEDLRGGLEKNLVTGYDPEDQAALQWDLGLDSRLLLMGAVVDIGGDKEPLMIPMLMEASGALGWGRWTMAASVGPRKTSSASGEEAYYLYSRHHWLQYRVADEFVLRAGKMVLPFGLRLPDHTVTTRRGLGFNQYGQSYGVSFNWESESLAVDSMAFVGEAPWKKTTAQERGVSASAAYLIPGRAALGVSGLVAQSAYSSRLAGGGFVRAQGPGQTYCLAEVDLQRRSNASGSESHLELVGYTRVGWFPRGWLDVFVDFRYLDFLTSGVAAGQTPREVTGMLGANWQVLPWVEVSPGVMLKESETGRELSWLGQLHVIY